MKRYLFILLGFALFIQACRSGTETPEVAKVLSAHFKNKLYNQFDTAAYIPVFKQRLQEVRAQLSNPNTIESYFEQKGYAPELTTRHYTNGDIDSLISYLERSKVHGYSPSNFGVTQLREMKAQLDANQFKTIEEVYPVVAALEIQAAASLLKYHSMVNYGSLNPRKVLTRYYISVARPDSVSMLKVLDEPKYATLLQKIQPRSAQYLAFQKELAKADLKQPLNPKLVTILVNMERLRWKMPETGEEYVEVNIPDFKLTWFKGADTLSQMKVCVGAKREANYKEKMEVYSKTRKVADKPKNHETPLLFSKLHSIQVNPIWNIPVSIAQSEIYRQAANDRYYLSNNNMRVYYKGKLVADPDTIQWSRYTRERLPFQFKQGAGEGNALGKFKFIFDNGSSIYLHDTNNKAAFHKQNRAISHGCVRVERPLEFAELMVNNKQQYDNLRMEVNLPPVDTTRMEVFRKKQAKKTDSLNRFVLKPSWFGSKKQVPILINYKTAWWQNGVMEQRADVYGFDEALWLKLKRFVPNSTSL